MTTASTTKASPLGRSEPTGHGIPRRSLQIWAAAVLGLLALVTGCQTPPDASAPSEPGQTAVKKPEALTIREGDVLKIAFPGTPNLDTQQAVRRDGRISLSIVGEVLAIALTPAELEKELIKIYSSQLVSKEVTVTVVSSSYAIYVTGAVIRPGKIDTNRPMSAIEAVMEAGGFDNAKANTKAVVVIRNEGGQIKNYKLNLKLVLEGKQSEPFYLKPSDIVVVPEKFSWF